MRLHEKISSISGFKVDLLANFAGTGFSAGLQLVCIPLYIKFMGIEAYGLIGFFLMLTALLQVLDLGLSPTMNREMARYSVQGEGVEARDLVRTLEVCYWLIGLIIGVAMFAASPWIASHWIQASAISNGALRHTLMLMALLAVFQWPLSFYQGGLMGLGRQFLYNAIMISFAVLSSLGAVLILWLVMPSIQMFFSWLVLMNFAKVFLLGCCLWRNLPPASRAARFDFGRIRSIRSFATGMTGITVCSLILTQSDKVILSRLLPLKMFGYYALAGVFGTGLSMIATSMFNTIFPRFSALAVRDEAGLTELYHRSTQIMAVIILPIAAVIAFFSTDILRLWTRNPDVAHNAGPIATLLVIGSALNGLMNVPYALQLAYGWTSIGLRIAFALTIFSVPAVCLLTIYYGSVGAACVWPLLNGIYMVVGVPLTHHRLLKGAARQWWKDVGTPLIPILLVGFMGRDLLSVPMSIPLTAVTLLLLLFSSAVAAALVSPSIREQFTSRQWAQRFLG